jgi:DNA-binding response OmpR family regulator
MSVEAGRLRVLVADRYQDAADSLAMLLETWGCDVRVAYASPEAQILASTFRPDVVLLDTTLAYEFGREHEGIIIGMACELTEADRISLHAAGAGCCLVKPVDPTLLQQIIGHIAKQRPPLTPANPNRSLS